jgi:hypothetical protein
VVDSGRVLVLADLSNLGKELELVLAVSEAGKGWELFLAWPLVSKERD